MAARPVLTDWTFARPAVGGQDRRQPCRMSIVDRSHTRVITLEEGPVGGELRSHPSVLRGHLQQLASDRSPIRLQLQLSTCRLSGRFRSCGRYRLRRS